MSDYALLGFFLGSAGFYLSTKLISYIFSDDDECQKRNNAIKCPFSEDETSYEGDFDLTSDEEDQSDYDTEQSDCDIKVDKTRTYKYCSSKKRDINNFDNAGDINNTKTPSVKSFIDKIEENLYSGEFERDSAKILVNTKSLTRKTEKMLNIIENQSHAIAELVRLNERFLSLNKNEAPVQYKETTSQDTTPENSEKKEDNTKKLNNEYFDDEIHAMFDEELRRSSRTVEETLEIGKNVGEEPIAFFSGPGGGYATIGQVKKMNEDSRKFHEENRLKRADELDIMHTFNNIRGMNFHQALGIVEEQGYTLYPIYVNNGIKIPRSVYAGNVLGVSIEDNEFNFCDHFPSKKARIISIIDVGGQDDRDRGKNTF